MTLTEAYRRLFGTDLVLADSYPALYSHPKPTWSKIIDAATFYLHGLIASRAARHRATVEPAARVGITWGKAMHDLVCCFRREGSPNTIQGYLKGADKKLRAILLKSYAASQGIMQLTGNWPPEPTASIAASDYLIPGRVLVGPLVGIMGATDPKVEANENARILAEHFGGKSLAVSRYVFYTGTPLPAPQDLSLHWDQLDVAVLAISRSGVLVLTRLPKFRRSWATNSDRSSHPR